jgi:hypothetical protein
VSYRVTDVEVIARLVGKSHDSDLAVDIARERRVSERGAITYTKVARCRCALSEKAKDRANPLGSAFGTCDTHSEFTQHVKLHIENGDRVPSMARILETVGRWFDGG